MSRSYNRLARQIRPVTVEKNIAPHAQGSVLISFGNTKVICAATIEESVPRWMKEQNVPGGWITAEYSMLPYSTLTRKQRDSSRGRPDGRGTEIQRLIGRSLRAVTNLPAMGERQIVIDCDVIQADGGTRCASITGGWVALKMAVDKLLKAGVIVSDPMIDHVAAVSCGVYAGQPVLDLDYAEDSTAGTDGNFILTGRGRLIEVQMSAEGATFSREEMGQLLDLSEAGCAQLVAAQKAALGL